MAGAAMAVAAAAAPAVFMNLRRSMVMTFPLVFFDRSRLDVPSWRPSFAIKTVIPDGHKPTQ